MDDNGCRRPSRKWTGSGDNMVGKIMGVEREVGAGIGGMRASARQDLLWVVSTAPEVRHGRFPDFRGDQADLGCPCEGSADVSECTVGERDPKEQTRFDVLRKRVRGDVRGIDQFPRRLRHAQAAVRSRVDHEFNGLAAPREMSASMRPGVSGSWELRATSAIGADHCRGRRDPTHGVGQRLASIAIVRR